VVERQSGHHGGYRREPSLRVLCIRLCWAELPEYQLAG